MCAVDAVSRAYAVGPPRPATSARATATAMTGWSTARRGAVGPAAGRRNVGPTKSRNAPSIAAASTVQRSHGTKSADRPSRTNDHTPDPSVTTARTAADHAASRLAHSSLAPIPTSAAIAGARATV